MISALGTLSPVNLVAAAGIIGGVGGVPIAANSNLTNNISTYSSFGPLVQFANVAASGFVTINIVGSTFPALTNAVPAAYSGSLNTAITMTTTILNESANVLCGGDLGKFEQMFNTSDAYVQSMNLFIKSSLNAANANVGYTSQDSTITGGFSSLTVAFSSFSEDLASIGNLIDYDNLNNFGTPLALLQQIQRYAFTTPTLNTVLLFVGLPQEKIDDLSADVWTLADQKLAYQAMTKVVGTGLAEILKLLKITVGGIETLADLLNPVKIFPKSFNTFTTPTVNGLRGIYINASGAINSKLETQLPSSVLVPLSGNLSENNITYAELKQIIPADQALACKAITAALQQVKNVNNTNGPSLTIATKGLETNYGLNIINSFNQPVPPNVLSYFNSNFAQGTGENGLYLLTDLIGVPTGWIVNDSLSNTVVALNTLNSAGALNVLTNGSNGVYTIMQNTLDGDYTYSNTVPDPMDPGNLTITDYTVVIPSGLPGAGSYGPYYSIDDCFSEAFGNGLNPAMTSAVNNISSTNSVLVGYCNSNWSNIASQILTEISNQSAAGIVLSQLVAGVQPTGLATNLTNYGVNTSEGGPAYVLESLAVQSTMGGQAIISTMRQARNAIRLSTAGVESDEFISDEVAEPQASLTTGQYTAAQASGQKII